jgi:hypothetical protein
MASRVSVSIEKDDAIARINAVLQRIAGESDQSYDPLPTQGKDAEIVTKNQLVHLADALERLLAAPIVEALEGDPVLNEDADSEVEAPIPAKRHALKTDKSKKGES